MVISSVKVHRTLSTCAGPKPGERERERERNLKKYD